MTTALSAAIIDWVESQVGTVSSPQLLMVSGAQGIGKSSAMAHLATRDDPSIVVLGLDDFYLPRAERLKLAGRVHPLCETRGPPGTHDLALLEDVIDTLVHTPPGRSVSAPRFDKRRDDRVALEDWERLPTGPAAIILEGWMLGVHADLSAASAPPINQLEQARDQHGDWRGWQEEALAGAYADLWRRAHAFLHLRAPSFKIVEAWRCEQEETTLGLAPGALPVERRAWVSQFIQHYERLTRRLLSGDARPGTVLCVDEQRTPITGPTGEG